jgi:LacI family transcriptional regulator
MCADAFTAYGVVALVRDMGLDAPDDAMVVACEDDEIMSRACQPPLSAIDCRGQAAGYEAAHMLHRLLQGDTSIGASTCRLVQPGPVVKRGTTGRGRARGPAVRTALRFMRERLHRPLTIGDIARHAGLSRRTLERVFQREIGRTPAAELLSMRMERAAQLLLQTPLPVADVAAKCGFVSTAHFNSRFRRSHRCTPSEFRLRNLADLARPG